MVSGSTQRELEGVLTPPVPRGVGDDQPPLRLEPRHRTLSQVSDMRIYVFRKRSPCVRPVHNKGEVPEPIGGEQLVELNPLTEVDVAVRHVTNPNERDADNPRTRRQGLKEVDMDCKDSASPEVELFESLAAGEVQRRPWQGVGYIVRHVSDIAALQY